jgi:hypothetical protein
LGRLSITNEYGTTEYDIGAHLDRAGRIVGWRLVKDDDEGYDLDISHEPWACTCPDFTYRRESSPHPCKHGAALAAALRALTGGNN